MKAKLKNFDFLIERLFKADPNNKQYFFMTETQQSKPVLIKSKGTSSFAKANVANIDLGHSMYERSLLVQLRGKSLK